MYMSNSNHHILYINEFHSVIVVDIPASISSAQGYHSALSLPIYERRLISCPPVVQQYKTPEPRRKPQVRLENSEWTAKYGGKSVNAFQQENDERRKEANLIGKASENTVTDIEHARYRELIVGALVEIQEKYGSPLCGARHLRDGRVWDGESDDFGFERTGHEEIKEEELRSTEYVRAEEEGNRREEQEVKVADAKESINLGTLLVQICESEIIASKTRFSYILDPLTPSEVRDIECKIGSELEDCCQNDIHQTWEGFIHNSKDYIQLLSILKDRDKHCVSNNGGHSTNSINFYVPPHSTFLLNSCNDTASFHAAVRNMSNGFEENHNASRQFDLIILDPPWPNASAKRKRRSKHTSGGSYTQLNLREMRNLLCGMDLDRLIAPNGLIAIWITNKPAVRALVLGPGGLFEQWNVHLVEEWLWVKVTCRGEPVTPLDGSWRKPYEVLLLARAPAAEQLKSGVHERKRKWQGLASSNWPEVKYRVVVAVPDLHSRKPCLKSLLEPMASTGKLDDPNGSAKQKRKIHTCRALEVFARHLVAGWWSWGDQVLLYQWEGSWSSSEVKPSETTGDKA